MVTDYKKTDDKDVEFFRTVLSGERVITDKRKEDYSHDYTEDIRMIPEVVLLPVSTSEVSDIMRYCYEKRIPVTPRGAGTGLSGGAIPVYGGVVLSIEKMNKILTIDTRNHQVITQPGVITQILQEEVKKYGLFYPPDPASRGSCFIGGNIAENSGGPKAVKYGVTKDYVLNLEVVLPNGEIIWTGANTLKNATGYNLTQLFVGSEGTLGIITTAVLRLIPHPRYELLMMAIFDSLEKAAETVADIFMLGITPSGLELMEREAVMYGIKYIPQVEISLPASAEAVLLIELDGNDEPMLMREAEEIHVLLEKKGVEEVLFAQNSVEKEKLWKLRRGLGEAVKSHSIYKEEDTVVPRACLPELVKTVKQIGKKYGFQSVCYGHAGDGNLHVNILKGDMSETQWKSDYLKEGIREIFRKCKELGGTISGEHGIGLVQREYMKEVFTETELHIFRQIKHCFDPLHILNPGKILPEN